MSVLNNKQSRKEIEKLSELGYNFIAFNNGCVSGFRGEESPFLALGCYRTKSGYTGEEIILLEGLGFDLYYLFRLEKTECQMRLF